MNEGMRERGAEDVGTPVTDSLCVVEASIAAQPPARRRKASAKRPVEQCSFAHITAMAPVSPMNGSKPGSAGRSEVGRSVRAVGDWLRRAWLWLQIRRKWQISSKRLLLCESVSLGEKRFLAIVKVDDRHFLVGGAPGSVSMLATLGGEPEFAPLLGQRQRPRKATK